MPVVGFLTMCIDPDVVDEKDVDAVQAKARQAEFDGPHDPVVAE